MSLPLLLENGGLPLYESILNRSDDVGREYRSVVHRARYWLLPRLQEIVHGAPGQIVVDHAIRFHECSEQAAAKVDGVWRADILDDTVQDV